MGLLKRLRNVRAEDGDPRVPARKDHFDRGAAADAGAGAAAAGQLVLGEAFPHAHDARRRRAAAGDLPEGLDRVGILIFLATSAMASTIGGSEGSAAPPLAIAARAAASASA